MPFSAVLLIFTVCFVALLSRSNRDELRAEEIRRRYREVRSYREPRVLPDWLVWAAVACVIGAVVVVIVLVSKP